MHVQSDQVDEVLLVLQHESLEIELRVHLDFLRDQLRPERVIEGKDIENLQGRGLRRGGERGHGGAGAVRGSWSDGPRLNQAKRLLLGRRSYDLPLSVLIDDALFSSFVVPLAFQRALCG